ncbi:MAG: restriction endonuclease subunit S [Leptospiraceae bacterium]|nr:restriction endonuclease subunit S [Leptospiraceae bacterium]
MKDFSLVQNLSTLRKLPKTWVIKNFEEVLEDNSAGNFKIPKSKFESSGKIPIIDQGKNKIAGYLSDEKKIVKSEPPYIIFGDHTRIFKYIDFKFVMGADGVKVLQDKERNNYTKYIYYFLSQLNIPDTGYNRHFKYLKDIKIPLPPLDEQKKIAAILDAADEFRQKTKALLTKYDELAQSLFLDMFGDPVVNPKGWEVVKFSEVGKLDRGKSKHRPRNAPELLGGSHPLIQTGDIANSGIFVKTYDSTYSDIGLAQSKKWPSGTLCITIAANIAKTGILTFNACFPDSVVGFIPNENTNNIYAHFWMSFLQKILEETAPESAQKNINLAILRDLDYPLPPIELQNQFAERIQEIESQKANAEASLQKADDLFNCLLQKAFKGELT